MVSKEISLGAWDPEVSWLLKKEKSLLTLSGEISQSHFVNAKAIPSFPQMKPQNI